MKTHRETRLDRGERSGAYWDWPEYLLLEHGWHIADPGMIISPKQGERWCCLEGHVVVLGQTGGAWVACGSSRQTVIGQRGGWWDAGGESSQAVINQRNGEGDAQGRSRQTVINQLGGIWDAWDKSEQHRLKPKEQP